MDPRGLGEVIFHARVIVALIPLALGGLKSRAVGRGPGVMAQSLIAARLLGPTFLLARPRPRVEEAADAAPPSLGAPSVSAADFQCSRHCRQA